MIPDWRFWWTCPLLVFAGITGPGGYWLVLDADPGVVADMPPTLYLAILGVVLAALAVLAGAAVLAGLWVIDQIGELIR